MDRIQLNLDHRSCGLLDAVLAAFGDGDHLDQTAVLNIFGGDVNDAVKHINILAELRYIRKIAEIEGSRLGLAFLKEDGADLWLAQGGFTARYLQAAEEKAASDTRQSLADENARLENETLKYQATIRAQEARLRNLDEKVKRLELMKSYEWLIRLGFTAMSAFLTWYITVSG